MSFHIGILPVQAFTGLTRKSAKYFVIHHSVFDIRYSQFFFNFELRTPNNECRSKETQAAVILGHSSIDIHSSHMLAFRSSIITMNGALSLSIRGIPESPPGGLLDSLEILVVALIELNQHSSNASGLL